MLVDPWFVGDLTFAGQVRGVGVTCSSVHSGRLAGVGPSAQCVTRARTKPALCLRSCTRTRCSQDWMYRGRKRTIGRTQQVDLEQVASETDVIVLTQVLARAGRGGHRLQACSGCSVEASA